VLFVTHDLEEAISLSDRVVIMSAARGAHHRQRKVPLGRPRDIGESSSIRLHACIRNLDALKTK